MKECNFLSLPDLNPCMEWTNEMQEFKGNIHTNIRYNPYYQQHFSDSREGNSNIPTIPVTENVLHKTTTNSLIPSNLNNMKWSMTRTCKEMVDNIQTLNMYLMCCEMILAGEIQRLARDVYMGLEEKGLLRHQVKKYARELYQKSCELQRRSNMEDRRIVEEHCSSIMKSYANTYYEVGGSLQCRLQIQFIKLKGDLINRIRLCSKNAIDRISVPHSDIISSVMAILSLTNTGITIYNSVNRHIDFICGGRIKITRHKSMHNEAMAKAATNLIDQFISSQTALPQREGEAARELATQLMNYMTSTDMFQIADNCILALSMEYTEFALASLRMDMQLHTVSYSTLREMMARMSTKENVRKVLEDLGKTEIPEDTDIWDFAKVLPQSGTGNALNAFRRLCIEGKEMQVEEPRHVMVCRMLRKVARKMKGVLPMDVIKALMKDVKTKKKLLEIMKEAGPELDATARMVRKMKVAELR